MRTKALLVTAASALAAASAMAQVVSVNVVGFINLTVPPNGYALVANQLNTSDTKLATVIPTYSDGGQFITWDNVKASYTIYNYVVNPPPDYTGWTDASFAPANPDWVPGMGAFLFNPDTANPATVTLVGDVPQGTLSVTLPAGYTLVSSIPPLAEDAVTAGIPTADGEQLIKWDPTKQAYVIFNYVVNPPPDFTGWTDASFNPSTPAYAVGEGFFIFNSGAQMTWTRTFNVAP